jgi:multicomponent Na+:H+ antiporter subunit E
MVEQSSIQKTTQKAKQSFDYLKQAAGKTSAVVSEKAKQGFNYSKQAAGKTSAVVSEKAKQAFNSAKNNQKVQQNLDSLKQAASKTSAIATERTKKAVDSAKKIDKQRLKQGFTDLKHLAHQQSKELLDRNNPPQFRITVASIGLFIIWLFLISNHLTLGGIIAGVIAAILTAWLSSNHLTFIDHLKFSVAMPMHIARYLAVFFVALIKANFDMARRILSPKLPIDPVVVLVDTKLKSPLGKLLLANSITLTPGTLTVDVLDDKLQIHWVDGSQGTDLVHATQAISESFERHLREIIE